MKLHADKLEGLSISGHGTGWIAVNGEKKLSSILLSSRGLCLDWPCRRFDDLTADHFAQLATFDAELVLFGSGTRLRFPKAEWLQGLMVRRIGLETMDTAAACRTYNILAGEGRHVVAALLLESA
jgi:uncharacterized protein